MDGGAQVGVEDRAEDDPTPNPLASNPGTLLPRMMHGFRFVDDIIRVMNANGPMEIEGLQHDRFAL